MGFTLRYAAEMRSAAEYFTGIRTPSIDTEQLALAKELIQRKTAKFDPAKYTDGYEAALRELVDAKLKHIPVAEEQKSTIRAKVVDLMDALRRSVNPPSEKKPPARATSNTKAKTRGARNGQTVLPIDAKSVDKRRKSA
jgi:DNA end-binding protein Ku